MLSLSSEDYFLEEADSHIQANLEDSVVQEALRSGVDLREYSANVENELRQVEALSIQDYIRESKNIANLHNQIVSCDQILEASFLTLIRTFVLCLTFPLPPKAYGEHAGWSSVGPREHQLRDPFASETVRANESQAGEPPSRQGRTLAVSLGHACP